MPREIYEQLWEIFTQLAVLIFAATAIYLLVCAFVSATIAGTKPESVDR
jgi:hypothetical protein